MICTVSLSINQPRLRCLPETPLGSAARCGIFTRFYRYHRTSLCLPSVSDLRCPSQILYTSG